MYQLIGNAPNQIPTNADLGGLAYQDPQYVNITGGNVNVTNFSAANVVLGSVTSGFITGLANAQITGNILTGGNIRITDSTDTNTYNNGALIVTGGVGIGGNLVIRGNLAVQGITTTFNSADVSYEDSIINLHTFANLDPLGANDGKDIGVKMHYYDVEDATAFVGRANDTGYLEWYARGTEVANVFTGTHYGTIKSGAAWFANTTVSTSVTTGALVVNGGVGVAGNVYAGGLNVNASESISVTTVADANFTAPTKFLFSVGNIVAAATTAATSTTTGALVVTGGVGIGNGLYVNGISYLQNFSTANGHIISSDSAIGINHLNVVSAIGNIYAVSAQVTNFSSGNVRITGGYATGMANVTAGNLYVTNTSTIDYASNSVMPKAYTDAFSIIFGA